MEKIQKTKMESKEYFFVLGSQSPRRKEFIDFLKIPYEIKSSSIDEISNERLIKDQIIDISQQKATDIAKSFSNEFFILTADTTVVLNNKAYGKPESIDEAKAFLSELRGQTHQVITAFTFLYDEKVESFYEESLVEFTEFDEQTLNAYLETNDSLDKAGGYGIQGMSQTFIKEIRGSYSNVVGLPIHRVIKELSIIFGANWREHFKACNV